VGSHMLGSNPPLLHSLAVGPVCLGVLELAYFCFLPAPHSVTSGRRELETGLEVFTLLSLAQLCNLSYSGGWGRRIMISRAAWVT
jgi:hypothetical protein